MARLATYVHVADGENPEAWFGPDDELPSWAIAFLANNPLVWDEAPSADDTSEDVAAWLEAEAKHKSDVAEWLAAEADHKAEAEQELDPKPVRRGRPKKAATTEE